MSLGFLHFISDICTTLDQSVFCRSAEDFCWHIQATFDKLLAEEHSFSVLAAQEPGPEHNSLHCPFLPVLVFAAADHEHQECVQALMAGGSSHLRPTSLPCPFVSTWAGNFLPILLIVKKKTLKPEAITGCRVFGQELCRTRPAPRSCWRDVKSEFLCFV